MQSKGYILTVDVDGGQSGPGGKKDHCNAVARTLLIDEKHKL